MTEFFCGLKRRTGSLNKCLSWTQSLHLGRRNELRGEHVSPRGLLPAGSSGGARGRGGGAGGAPTAAGRVPTAARQGTSRA